MMSDIVLSIVVPTYNRAQLLKVLLESIVQSFEQWPKDLELIVSDNASPDETNSTVNMFIQRGVLVNYRINKTNIGGDANVGSCFDLASGKYLWIIGDDEIMYRGTVQYVLELCRKNEFGLLHIASQGFSHGQQAEVCLRKKPEKVDIKVLDSKRLFRQANVFLTFISANVINRQAVLSRFPDFDAKAEFNTNLPQLAWTYSALKAMDDHYFIHTPLFGALGGNTSGYKLIEVFGINLINITKKYLHNMIPNAERIMSNAVITNLLAGELISLSNDTGKRNQFASEDIEEAVKSAFSDNLFYMIFIRPILSSSRFAQKITWIALRIFNKLNRMLNYRLL